MDIPQLDELDKMFALRSSVSDLNRAKEQADREGWIDADEAERLLGGSRLKRIVYSPEAILKIKRIYQNVKSEYGEKKDVK